MLLGVALTFGMWWMYLAMPAGDILEARRARSFSWGYGHMVIFGAIVAAGAGIHNAAYLIDGESDLSTVGTLASVAIPLAVFVGATYVLYSVLTRSVDPFHAWLVAGSAAVLVAALALGSAGLPLMWCLLVMAAVPWVTVLGYELRGYRHKEEVMASLMQEPDTFTSR